MADNTIATAYVQLVASADGMTDSITEAMGGAGTSAGNSFGSTFTSVLGGVAKTAGAALAAAATGVTALTSAAINNYAEYEQLVGGVETLFKDSADVVQEYAANAFKTSGMSANEYMNTVTSFAASLIQSLDGDTEAAASKAQTAIEDMADNANKMGTAIESIQNAYQGFAKQNYTMLDNLKLGYGGTKSEMERLLADATAISGIEFSIDSYADIVEAIHIIQQNMGITGTTALEASETITGSMSSIQAAWQNVLTGIADENADFEGQIEALVATVGAFAGNMLPRITTAIAGVGKLVTSLAPIVAEMLPEMFATLLPELLNSISTLINSAAGVLPQLITTIVKAIGNGLPQIITTFIQGFTTILNGISAAMPTLIPSLVQAMVDSIIAILNNLPELMDAAEALIQGISNGILASLPILMDALPAIIEGIVTFFMKSTSTIMEIASVLLMAMCDAIPLVVTQLTALMPDIITAIVSAVQEAGPEMLVASVELLSQLLVAIPEIVAMLWAAMPDVILAIIGSMEENWPKLVENGKESAIKLVDGFVDSTVFKSIGNRVTEIVNKFKENFDLYAADYVEVGKNIILGLINGIKSMASNVASTVSDIASTVANTFTDFFDIHSPSRLFYRFGAYIDEGLANGIDAGISDVSSAMNALNGSVVSEFGTGTIAGIQHCDIAGAGMNGNASLMDLLATYLPIIADGKNVNVSLEGDAKGIFNMVRAENRSYIEATGSSAFIY